MDAGLEPILLRELELGFERLDVDGKESEDVVLSDIGGLLGVGKGVVVVERGSLEGGGLALDVEMGGGRESELWFNGGGSGERDWFNCHIIRGWGLVGHRWLDPKQALDIGIIKIEEPSLHRFHPARLFCCAYISTELDVYWAYREVSVEIGFT